MYKGKKGRWRTGHWQRIELFARLCSAQPQSKQHMLYTGRLEILLIWLKERKADEEEDIGNDELFACLSTVGHAGAPSGCPLPHIFLLCHYHPHSRSINTTVLVVGNPRPHIYPTMCYYYSQCRCINQASPDVLDCHCVPSFHMQSVLVMED